MADAFPVLDDTDWAALTHAYGSAADAPAVLVPLLCEDPAHYGTALAYLDGAVLHQGTLYPATAPVALFVAGILDNPSAAISCTSDLPWDNRERPLRAALLEWLGSVAESAAYWDDKPAPAGEAAVIAQCQAIRPALYDAAMPFLDDPARTVRAAALSALGHLLKTPDLAEFREQTAKRLLRQAQGSDVDDRATTAIILGTWDVAPRALLADPNPSVRAVAAMARCLDGDPAALAEIKDALTDPAHADSWFPTGVPHLNGKLRFALVAALLRRTQDFDEILPEALAIADMTNGFTVDFDWGPLLERAFPQPHADGQPFTAAQKEFLQAILDNDQCWGTIGNSYHWLRQANLPYRREPLRTLTITG